MTHWLRFKDGGEDAFGQLNGDNIGIFHGEMFGNPSPSGDSVRLDAVTLLTPCIPTKIVGLWNNSRSAAEKQGLEEPGHPLFFIKSANTFLPGGGTIRKPASYDGRVIYEAELGIVIGKDCKEVSPADAEAYIFGYTCVNDVTALQILDADPSFPQWARAKGFDSFGAFGPVIATDIDLANTSIRAELNGRERQNYAVSDLMIQPADLVSVLSHDLTLYAGDIIACGTGPGALPMKAGATIDVIIDGIGTLSNIYDE